MRRRGLRSHAYPVVVVVGLAVAVLLVVVAVSAVFKPSSTAPRRVRAGGLALIAAGQRPAAKSIDGLIVQGRAQDFRFVPGRITLVNFWASWCVPCRKEAAALERYASEHSGEARLLSIAVNDHYPAAQAFARRYGWTFPITLDRAGDLLSPYRVPGLPTTVLVDRHGGLAGFLIGPQTTATLERAVRQLTGAH